VERAGLVDERRRQRFVAEAGAEPEAGQVVLDQLADVGPMQVLDEQLHPGAEQQLAAREPWRRILELRYVHPADRRSRRALAGDELELERADQIFDRQHACRRLDGYRSSLAALSTVRRTASISSNCSVSQISGGASCTTGSPRSSVRQISPWWYRAPERKPRSRCSDSSSSKVSLVVRSLTTSIAWKNPAPRTSPTIGMSRRLSSIARNSGSLARTCAHSSSRSRGSLLASATAAATGCPPKWGAWAKLPWPSRNGGASRSEAIIAPIGMFAEVSPLAVVMMSGT